MTIKPIVIKTDDGYAGLFGRRRKMKLITVDTNGNYKIYQSPKKLANQVIQIGKLKWKS